MTKLKKYTIESKLAIVLSVLGFFSIAMLQVLGLIVGFFMTIVAVYLGHRRYKLDQSDELAHAAFFFGLFSFVLILVIGTMYFFIRGI